MGRIATIDIDLEDIDDEDISEEFHERGLGNNDLVVEALTCIRQHRLLDAQTALERFLYPKTISAHDYEVAMSHKRVTALVAV
jgi:hypothetical protein